MKSINTGRIYEARHNAMVSSATFQMMRRLSREILENEIQAH